MINTYPLKPQVLKEQMQVDFIDVNMGCPIDLVYKKGQGSALMNRTNKLEQVTLNAAVYYSVYKTMSPSIRNASVDKRVFLPFSQSSVIRCCVSGYILSLSVSFLDRDLIYVHIQIVKSMKRVMTADDDYLPLTIKFRTGIQEGVNTAHTLIPKLKVGVPHR